MRPLLNKTVPQGGSDLYLILCVKELFNSVCAGEGKGKGFSDSNRVKASL